jgi:hypothetical protein
LKKEIIMHHTKRQNIERPILTDTKGLRELLGSGLATARRIGEEAGAKIRIGKRVLWRVDLIEEYLDTLAV